MSKTVTIPVHANWHAHWKIERYDEQGELYNTSEFENNGLANAGIDELWTLVGGTGATQFDSTNAYIGVGDDNTVFAAAQTDLQAVANKLRKGMEATYPTYGSSQKITFKSSFGGTDANWHWEEFGVFNASVAGVMLNRKVEDEGPKTAGQTWVVTLEITLS